MGCPISGGFTKGEILRNITQIIDKLSSGYINSLVTRQVSRLEDKFPELDEKETSVR